MLKPTQTIRKLETLQYKQVNKTAEHPHHGVRQDDHFKYIFMKRTIKGLFFAGIFVCASLSVFAIVDKDDCDPAWAPF